MRCGTGEARPARSRNRRVGRSRGRGRHDATGGYASIGFRLWGGRIRGKAAGGMGGVAGLGGQSPAGDSRGGEEHGQGSRLA
jgi:hypothetical protein